MRPFLLQLWNKEGEQEREIITMDSEAVSERKTLKKRGSESPSSAMEYVGRERDDS